MSFLRFRDGEVVDGDREGARRFLDERGLHLAPWHESSTDLLHADGSPLAFDGYATDLHLHPLDTAKTFAGGIWHATLTDEECRFIFDLCVACGFLVCDHQAGGESPMFVVPRGTHQAEHITEMDEELGHVFVDTADELRTALAGGFQSFVEYRNRVLGRDPD